MSGILKNIGLILMLIFAHLNLTLSFPSPYWAYDPGYSGIVLAGKPSIDDKLSVKISGKLALCHHMDKGHILLEVSGGTPPYDFTWNNHDKNQNRYNLLAGTYTVFITDSKGLVHQERIVIQPPFPLIVEMEAITHASCSDTPDGSAKIDIRFGRGEPYKIIWSHGLEDEIEANNLVPGQYTVNVIDKFNCDVTLSFDIKSNVETIEVKESIQQINCSPDGLGAISLQVSGGQAPYDFLWSNGHTSEDIGNLEEGTYDVTITDQLGCKLFKSFEIVASSSFEVNAVRIQHNSCSGTDEGEIDLEIIGGQSPFVFSWSNGDTVQNIKNLKAGVYTARILDANGCNKEIEVEVEESQRLTARINSSFDVNCESGEVFAYVWVNIEGGVSPYSITWDSGEKDVQEIPVNQSKEVSVEIFDSMGCKVTQNLYIEFPFDFTIANRLNFDVRKLSISADSEVQVLEPLLFESKMSEDFIAWEWNFGDGNNGTERDPVHTYKKAGEFEVILKAYDIYGCSSVQSKVVTVTEPDVWVTIPNAFTPNGDGLNDVFSPVLKGIVDFQMDIFSHWGEHIYSVNGLEFSGWDGTHKGQLLPRGNYVYKVQFSTNSGESVHRTGTVTLVR